MTSKPDGIETDCGIQEESKGSVISVYRIDKENIGDIMASPRRYFPYLGSKELDVGQTHLKEARPKIKGKFVVVGGGGLIDQDFFMARGCISGIPVIGAMKSVAWGVGTNSLSLTPNYAALWRYDLVGCRDWGTPYDWVPCVSCMSPLFDEIQKVKPSSKVVSYLHHTRMFKSDYAVMSNKTNDFQSMLNFMAQGEVVITNTYHGAYWATLLGRKVVVVDPWSTKFLFMRHRPVISSISDLNKAIGKAVNYQEALSECRLANKDFSKKVRNLLSDYEKEKDLVGASGITDGKAQILA